MSTLKIKRENGKIFCPLADSWHIETPEEKVRQEYIKRSLMQHIMRKTGLNAKSAKSITSRLPRISFWL